MATLDALLATLSPDERVRGKQFEKICQWYLRNAPAYKALVRRVWLWDEWPGRWGIDAGIDLVAETHSGDLWAVQAKAYGRDEYITKAGIDSFLSESSRSDFQFRLLISSSDLIGRTALRTVEAQEKPVGLLLRSDLAAMDLEWPESPDHLSPPPVRRFLPRPHQREALDEVQRRFGSADRGQLIMACGTGKTLLSLWLHEEMKSRRTLVLVPSLSLLKQTLLEWTAHASAPFEYIAVCSDETVAPDEAVQSANMLGVPVTTDKFQIAEFLKKPGDRIVFSTYQSSPVIAEALKGSALSFDLAVADEAHRCAGASLSPFATILDESAIPVSKRLFMTATPRIITDKLRGKREDQDFELVSMDDPQRFGEVFHHLSFSEAISRGLLSDYRVLVIGIDDETYHEYAQSGQFVTLDGTTVTDARTVASQIGILKAMKEYDLKRIISFHGRIKGARAFSDELPRVAQWLPEIARPTGSVVARHVSGEMSAGERSSRLNLLKSGSAEERTLLSNARCLAEGVDVPAIDGVAFIDPRRSQIDIVQAVGRAIRLSPGKEVGTVVIPVFIAPFDDPEAALEDSAFEPVWSVVKALRAHDQAFGDRLDSIRVQLGRGRVKNVQLPPQITIDLPRRLELSGFAEAMSLEVVEKATSSWEYGFGWLLRYLERTGTARVPFSHMETDDEGRRFNLGAWVNGRRNDYRLGRQDAERVGRLEALPGWSWNARADSFLTGMSWLFRYIKRTGTSRVPRATPR